MTSAVVYDSKPNEALTYICPTCNKSAMVSFEKRYSPIWHCHECGEDSKEPHLRTEFDPKRILD